MPDIILDLCAGTKAWSNPYKEAGYNVIPITLPENDVLTYKPPDNVYGILAAPPCTMFSFARTRAKKPRDLKEGMETVIACLNIIWECQYKLEHEYSKTTTLKFWCLENPYGFLNRFLGKPALIFNPYDYGDRYQKKTCLWGNFKEPAKNPIELNESEKAKFATNSQRLKTKKDVYGDMSGLDMKEILEMDKIDNFDRQSRRAITPPGFAKAFYEVNK